MRGEMEVSDPFLQSREWLDLRYRVLQKSKGCCQLCGARGGEGNPIQVDHIKPRSKYPQLALTESNLQVLCRTCNLGKSNRDDTDWRLMPSREFEILESAEPAEKAKLQQLGWLKINGIDKFMKREADRQYRELWGVIEGRWRASKGGR
jgi:hypothetical protein